VVAAGRAKKFRYATAATALEHKHDKATLDENAFKNGMDILINQK